MTQTEQNQILEKWLGEHKRLLFKVVLAYAALPMDREDLFQEIVIQVWHSIPTFKGQSSNTTWMYRIALNTAIKWSVKEKKQVAGHTDLDDFEPILMETEIQIDERLTWLYEEIHKLDEIDRSLMLLLLEGFSYKEMAEMLGISEGNIAVKINRIKKKLITKSKL